MLTELSRWLQRCPSLTEAKRLIYRRRTWLVGNGGSAAVASHIANDMIRMGIPAVALVDPPTLSANANDFGWQEGFSRQGAILFSPGDLAIAISSSGRSPNVLNAAKAAKEKGCDLLTLSGFFEDNPLRQMGDVNLWVDSQNYGVVEIAHLAMLHEMVKP